MTSNGVVNTENNSINYREGFRYSPAGNICAAYPNTESYEYDSQNKLTFFRGIPSYDADGNMLTSILGEFAFDSSNRLISTLTNSSLVTYTYDAEGTRIKSECGEDVVEYIYNTNARLSQLLVKTDGDVTTKYVYGLGLIGEETNGEFKTYHFDLRGSTVAITDENCNVTDTFEYDTYGKLVTRTGTSKTPFMYNGRDGVITEDNGLYYMRARYYSPVLKRFINADIVAGSIANAVTLNRYAYANCNPVSNVDPLGLSAEERGGSGDGTYWTVPDANVSYLPAAPIETNASKCVKGANWALIGIAAICVSISVLTCGTATPVMTVIAGTTFVAGTATTVNGAAEIGDAITGYNFIEDGVFQGDSEAYDIYSNTTALVAGIGTAVCGGWLKANAPRIDAYNNIGNYEYTNTISDSAHMTRPYSNSTLTQKQVIKYGEMAIDEFTSDGYVFSAPGKVNGSVEKEFRLVVDIVGKKVLHWGHGF